MVPMRSVSKIDGAHSSARQMVSFYLFFLLIYKVRHENAGTIAQRGDLASRKHNILSVLMLNKK